jgi:DNA-binding MarR family transcriptional regulator
MNKNEILKELIDHFFAFDAEKDNREEYSMAEFIGYLNAKSRREELEIRRISGEKERWFDDEYSNATRDISILIVLMYRYAKGYIKKALRESLLQTADEFSFLITLMTYESLRKSDLISRQVMEKTTGTEVIRRLVHCGLISETANENDKRSIRVSITEAGREEILSILPLMRKVSEIVVGNLSVEEINTLAYLLKKLDYFHNDIYLNKRDLPLNILLSEIKHTTD